MIRYKVPLSEQKAYLERQLERIDIDPVFDIYAEHEKKEIRAMLSEILYSVKDYNLILLNAGRMEMLERAKEAEK